MATLTAWKFDDPDEAERAMHVLEDLQKQELIDVIDGAWVTWPAGRRAPKTHQMHHGGAAVGALGGGYFGLLFGVLFFVPLLGLAIGAAAGAGIGKLTAIGIDDGFVEEVRQKVTPGTSALFALTDAAVEDPVSQALSKFHAELITSNLSPEQEQHVRETFFAD
jgi:uncharacterized membrane protein